jgi:hypothetical protein
VQCLTGGRSYTSACEGTVGIEDASYPTAPGSSELLALVARTRPTVGPTGARLRGTGPLVRDR